MRYLPKRILNACFIIWCIFLAYLLLLPVRIDFTAPRKTNFIPFKTIHSYMNYIKRLGIINKKVFETDFIFNISIFNTGFQNLAANILFFIPLGIGLSPIFKADKLYKGIVLSFLTPVFIELWQYIFCPTRTFDVDDIILNFIGMLIGCIIYWMKVRVCTKD